MTAPNQPEQPAAQPPAVQPPAKRSFCDFVRGVASPDDPAYLLGAAVSVGKRVISPDPSHVVNRELAQAQTFPVGSREWWSQQQEQDEQGLLKGVREGLRRQQQSHPPQPDSSPPDAK